MTTAILVLTCAPSLLSEPSRPQVVAGDGVREKGFLTAGPQGAVIAIPGEARVELDPGASVQVFAAAQRLKMPEGYAVPTWSVAVREGRVRATVRNPKKAAILLTASEKFSTVVVRGTGMLWVDASESAAVNLTGVSHTVIAGRWQALEEGTLRSVNAGETTPSTRHTLAPTSIESGPRLWVSMGEEVTLDALAWKPVTGAANYTVALRRAGEDEPMRVLTTSNTQLAKPLGSVGPGQYDVAVRGNDTRGLPGRWSQPVRMRVLGVDLPGGAYVSSKRVIHLGPGQHTRFTNSDGLELTYTGARRYVSADSEVPLYREQRTLVSFREPGSLENAIAWLEPRAISADVEIGPAAARWPKDNIEVSIRLQSTSQDAPLRIVEPRPKVMVGIDPVQVEWRWEGSALKGTIPARNDDGPWVIRVEVDDQYGIPLGRNVLEVARSGG